MAEVPRKGYEKEHYYQATLLRQAKAYDELLARFPESDEEARTFLQDAHNKASATDPSFILHPDRLKELKNTKPELFDKIDAIYSPFLKEKAGLT